MKRQKHAKGAGKDKQQRREKGSEKGVEKQQESGEGGEGCIREGTVLIDGSILEGGGQILRNCFSLSSLLKKPISIVKIRANRDKPGLAAQHLKGIELINEIYQGELRGGELRSSQVTYHPKQFKKADKFIADCKTAGSVCLLIQISLPCFIFAPFPITSTFIGGTNAAFAPPIDYLIEVFRPLASQFGIDFNIEIEKRGFHPRGGGIVHLNTHPVKELRPITILNRGKVVRIISKAFVSGNIPIKVAERMVTQAKKTIESVANLKEIDYQEQLTNDSKISVGDGTMIQIIATTDTGCIFAANAIGERGVTSEQVADTASTELVKNLSSGGCVDEHMQDQLIIFMALAKGTSSIKTGPLEMHTKTSIHYAQLLSGAKFTITPTPADQRVLDYEDTCTITCEGIGLQNEFL